MSNTAERIRIDGKTEATPNDVTELHFIGSTVFSNY